MTGAVLYHLNRSLVRLRDRLQTDTSDALVMTIIVLAKTFLTCGEYKAAGIHIKALKRVVVLRGGYDKLGWDGFVGLKAQQ